MNDSNRTPSDPDGTPDDRPPEPTTESLLPPRLAPPNPTPEAPPSTGSNALNLFDQINEPSPNESQLAREETEQVRRDLLDLKTGDTLGNPPRFQLGELIYHCSGKTAVFEGFDLKHGNHRVAIKVVLSQSAALPLRRLQEEAQIMARLDPLFAPILYDSGIEASHGFVWMAMEYLEGGTLHSWIQKEKRLSWEQARKVCTDTLEALRNSYSHGLAHRDLKPSNIMRSKEGSTWKIADWGMARSLPIGTGVAVDYPMGTTQYMAPECWNTPAEYSRQSDFYALGMILLEMLTGRNPFASPRWAETREAQRTINLADYLSQTAEVPADARRIVARATASNPADRYEDVDAFLADLNPCEAAKTRKRRNKLPLALAAGAALALLAAGFFYPWRSAPVKYKGQLDLWLMERDEKPFEQPVGGPRTLPLRTGDGIVLKGKLEQGAPAHFYVLWIDSNGQCNRVHPKKWSEKHLPPLDEKQQELLWPSPGDRQTLGDSTTGLESILWLVRDKPLDQRDNAELQKLLDGLKWRQKPEWKGEEIIAWWEDGERAVNRGAPERRAAYAEDNPIRQTEKLAQGLKERGLARYSRAVCYSFVGR